MEVMTDRAQDNTEEGIGKGRQRRRGGEGGMRTEIIEE